jgi:AcrR family transcriptional regulator
MAEEMERSNRRKTVKAVAESPRLDVTAWVDTALQVLAEQGVDGIRVEVLAKKLNVTKGSFYWHFKDRAALLDATLQEWRRRATLGIIDRLEKTHEPAQRRLVRLLRLQFEAKRAEFGADIELSVRLWGRSDRRAAEVLREVDELRLRYIGGLLEEHGIEKNQARARAILIYCYMRVSRTLLDSTAGRETLQECEALLTGAGEKS